MAGVAFAAGLTLAGTESSSRTVWESFEMKNLSPLTRCGIEAIVGATEVEIRKTYSIQLGLGDTSDGDLFISHFALPEEGDNDKGPYGGVAYTVHQKIFPEFTEVKVWKGSSSADNPRQPDYSFGSGKLEKEGFSNYFTGQANNLGAPLSSQSVEHEFMLKSDGSSYGKGYNSPSVGYSLETKALLENVLWCSLEER